MDIFQTALIISTFLCSLVAGFLFAYATVIMPGIKYLDDREFISAFQVTDRIIQNNHPIFMMVWLGSVIAMIVSAIFGFGPLQGVEVTTAIIHLPLNNELQALDVKVLSDTEIKLARNKFEPRWNRFNLLRTVMAGFVSVLLIILLYRQ